MTEFEIGIDDKNATEKEQPPDNEQEYYSVADAAKLLKISYDAVIKRIERGTLHAEKVDKEWQITKESLMQTRQQPKRNFGTNQININISDELKTELEHHKSRLNLSAVFEAGMWMLLAEMSPDVTYQQATNQARQAIGNPEIVESAWETSAAIVA